MAAMAAMALSSVSRVDESTLSTSAHNTAEYTHDGYDEYDGYDSSEIRGLDWDDDDHQDINPQFDVPLHFRSGDNGFFELTIRQAQLSKFLCNASRMCVSCLCLSGCVTSISRDGLSVYTTDDRVFDVSEMCCNVDSSLQNYGIAVPREISVIISEYAVWPVYAANKVMASHMEYIVSYLIHHNGITPPKIIKPIRSVHMEDIVHDPWDAVFIDRLNHKDIFQVILVCLSLSLSLSPSIHHVQKK